MESLSKTDLSSFSSMRVHSIAKVLYLPTSIDEILPLIKTLKETSQSYYILSAGSNVVFNDYIDKPIICLMKLNDDISYNAETGLIKVGCSVRIQKLINELKKYSLGGIEYLYTLPASVGGIVYMNAGRGKKCNQSISDYLESVEVLCPSEGIIKTLPVNKNEFSHRHSPYQNTDYIILSATFKFLHQDATVTDEKIKERLEFSKKFLSADKPSCGSVFCRGNRFLFRLMRGMRVGDAMFSKKTSDWISNMGNAKGSDVIKLIRKAEKLHRLLFSQYETEIRIFE